MYGGEDQQNKVADISAKLAPYVPLMVALIFVIVIVIMGIVAGIIHYTGSQKFAPIKAERSDQGFQNQEPPVFYEYPSQLLEEYQQKGDNYKEQQFSNVPMNVPNADSSLYQAAARAFTPSRQGFGAEPLELPKPY